jgi:catechol 2,3-dioxygenase-like lactoylglutathione lyase family enzyme
MVNKPRFTAVDHVSRTVPDLDGAVRFYVEVFAALELFRIGPIDAADPATRRAATGWRRTSV